MTVKLVLIGRHDESEKRLPKSCLVLLCKYEPVLRWSRDCDNSLYQGLVEILIPDVLRPIPSKTQNKHGYLCGVRAAVHTFKYPYPTQTFNRTRFLIILAVSSSKVLYIRFSCCPQVP